MQEFSFTKPPTAEQAGAEAARSQRVAVDAMLDDEELPEQRWPFKSPRGKVRLFSSCVLWRHHSAQMLCSCMAQRRSLSRH